MNTGAGCSTTNPGSTREPIFRISDDQDYFALAPTYRFVGPDNVVRWKPYSTENLEAGLFLFRRLKDIPQLSDYVVSVLGRAGILYFGDLITKSRDDLVSHYHISNVVILEIKKKIGELGFVLDTKLPSLKQITKTDTKWLEKFKSIHNHHLESRLGGTMSALRKIREHRDRLKQQVELLKAEVLLLKNANAPTPETSPHQ